MAKAKKKASTMNDMVLRVYRKMLIEEKKDCLEYRLNTPYERAAFYTGYAVERIRNLVSLDNRTPKKVRL